MTYLELNNKYNKCDPPPDITYVCSFGLHLCLIGNVPGTLCSWFMRFRFMRFSIYAVLGIGPYSCFTRQYSHIMRFLVKIIVHKILVIFILHLCYSCIMRFFLGNKKRVNGELSVFEIFASKAKKFNFFFFLHLVLRLCVFCLLTKTA